ncbi:class I SAM-dependent methyltransferase [Nocardia carnea]|uniref:class I SAM-dependent methyltransferase n=1 Tax=Nocardia carnea TaxID=37328 RepID=UPI002453C2B3|nr:class I SAM-dependent methyltransferase [Nocardia carnea]
MPEFAREILAEARTQGNKLFLSKQLTTSDYKKVNRVIETMGGKWNRREQAHVFQDDPAEIIAAALASGTTPNTVRKVLEAYFATPHWLARHIVAGEYSDIADLEAGAHVLEPSAGDGALVRAILETNPNVHVTAVEPEPERAAEIGHDPRVTVVVSSFEQFSGTAPRQFAAVAMNPPFALPHRPTVWMDHLYAAWDLLADGGQLLAVGPGNYTFRREHYYRRMREFITEHGGYKELPARAFATSGTDVDTVLLYARRPYKL